jgi:hypothetical protein
MSNVACMNASAGGGDSRECDLVQKCVALREIEILSMDAKLRCSSGARAIFRRGRVDTM